MIATLLLTVAHASRWAGPTCVEPGDVPFLVPLHHERHGRVAPRGTWVDEQGNRYRFDAVERTLRDHPIAGDAYRRWRRDLQEAHEVRAGVAVGEGLFGPIYVDDVIAVLDPKQEMRVVEALALVPPDRPDTVTHFLRAVCLYNATQPMLVAQAREREHLMAELTEARGGEGPPLSAWAFTEQLYRETGLPRPEPEAWRADVEAIWEHLQAGEDQDQIRAATLGADAPSLAARLAGGP